MRIWKNFLHKQVVASLGCVLGVCWRSLRLLGGWKKRQTCAKHVLPNGGNYYFDKSHEIPIHNKIQQKNMSKYIRNNNSRSKIVRITRSNLIEVTFINNPILKANIHEQHIFLNKQMLNNQSYINQANNFVHYSSSLKQKINCWFGSRSFGIGYYISWKPYLEDHPS